MIEAEIAGMDLKKDQDVGQLAKNPLRNESKGLFLLQ